MTGSSTFTLVLTGDVSVKSAQDVLGRLREAVAGHAAIAIDTQDISQADVTTVQTLLSARAKAEALGKSLTLKGPPGPKLQAVLEGAGFLNPAQPAARFWTEHI
ncbi:STAS domain-containing protein [Devosia sp.]|uniref:STAS domain-containing protein n=1 Tax=Devosia sp. TaxID=1871048 RepID=UPI001B04ACC2|nr:STAS domain-containing protein [Devosia sp.]MBO9590126.1 STAS domain-containing protein [Devosia sp.]